MKERYVLLDSIRGITLLSMILYHGMFDLVGPQRFTLKATRRKGGFFYECGIFGKRVSSKLSNGPPL